MFLINTSNMLFEIGLFNIYVWRVLAKELATETNWSWVHAVRTLQYKTSQLPSSKLTHDPQRCSAAAQHKLSLLVIWEKEKAQGLIYSVIQQVSSGSQGSDNESIKIWIGQQSGDRSWKEERYRKKYVVVLEGRRTQTQDPDFGAEGFIVRGWGFIEGAGREWVAARRWRWACVSRVRGDWGE